MNCAFETCNRQAQKREWCRAHYQQWRRTGELWELGTNPHRGRKRCEFPDCGRYNFSHGLCGAHAKQRRLGQELRPIREARPEDTESKRWCSTCKQYKRQYLFPANPPGRMARTCDDCRAEYMARYNSTPEAKLKRRWYRAEKKYGISREDYQDFWDQQGGECAICRSELTHLIEADEYKSAIDHDHGTGAVRGLLCNPCNCAIGYMQDDPARLESAATYLRRAAA